MEDDSKDLQDSRALYKREIIKKISRHVNLSETIVKMVYEGFIDVAAAEIANKGKFEIHELFKISVKDSKSGFSKGSITERMTAKLSNSLRRLRKLKLQGKVRNIEPRNVKEKLSQLQRNKVVKKKNEISLESLLSDDDED